VMTFARAFESRVWLSRALDVLSRAMRVSRRGHSRVVVSPRVSLSSSRRRRA
jgi:hypothetical protein